MDIFKNNHDYERMVAGLYLFNSDSVVRTDNLFQGGKTFLDIFSIETGNNLVHILAYCLMPNHFHIIVKENSEGGVAKFMQKLSTSYAMYFNSKYKRTGSLFEGKFKSIHVDTDGYLNYLFRYVHLNPLKIVGYSWGKTVTSNTEKVRRFMDEYIYSSYHDYFGGERPQRIILAMKSVPEQFFKMNDLDILIKEWNSQGRSCLP